ncbi:MAG: hypothetical protein HY815_24220, partial [Candidatus Riflebacteria bacterium]|nr:hypothetical protein [Candidatus Riflebacteria bacterium]
MQKVAVRRTAVFLIVALVGQLLHPCLALAGQKEFDTVLSGLPILPEKANEPFPIGLGDQVATMELRIFLDIMAKPEMLDLTFVPMVADAVMKKKLGVRIRNVTKGEAFSLVLQLNELKAVQFNERTVIIVPTTDKKEFGLKTRKIYRLTHVLPKKVKEFISQNAALSAIIQTKNIIQNDDGLSLLVIDTEQNIALIDSVVALLDQKPNKIEAVIKLSFLTGTEFTTAIGQMGTDVQQRINTKAMYYSEKGRALVVYDTPDNVEFIKALVKKIDLSAKQVLIDTSIMTVKSEFARQLGVRMTSTGFTVDSLDRLLNQNRLNAYLTSTNQLTSQAQITYLITKNGGQTLANPKIRTLDNERASITIGDIIVVRIVSQTQQQAITGQSAVSQNVTPQEVQTGVQLSVKPTIHHDKTVTLELTVSNDTPTQIKDYGVDRNTTNSTSKLRVRDSETVILGGFIKKTDDWDKSPVPFIGEVPILRSIFNVNSKKKQATELVILLTPYLLEYLTNRDTGEAEIPRPPGKSDEELKPTEPPQQQARAPVEPPREEKLALRSPSGQPLVRNIYDTKGRIILRHAPGAESSPPASTGGTAQQVASAAAPGPDPTGPLSDLKPLSANGAPGGSDRGAPIATFRPAPQIGGTGAATVGAPAGSTPAQDPPGPAAKELAGAREATARTAAGAGAAGVTLDRYEKAVESTASWLRKSMETGDRISGGNVPKTAEFSNVGRSVPTGLKTAPAPSPAVLESFGRAVKDTTEWKQGVVDARKEGAPDRMKEYGLMSRYGQQVADMKSWGQEVSDTRRKLVEKAGAGNGSPSPGAGDAPPVAAEDSSEAESARELVGRLESATTAIHGEARRPKEPPARPSSAERQKMRGAVRRGPAPMPLTASLTGPAQGQGAAVEATRPAAGARTDAGSSDRAPGDGGRHDPGRGERLLLVRPGNPASPAGLAARLARAAGPSGSLSLNPASIPHPSPVERPVPMGTETWSRHEFRPPEATGREVPEPKTDEASEVTLDGWPNPGAMSGSASATVRAAMGRRPAPAASKEPPEVSGPGREPERGPGQVPSSRARTNRPTLSERARALAGAAPATLAVGSRPARSEAGATKTPAQPPVDAAMRRLPESSTGPSNPAVDLERPGSSTSATGPGAGPESKDRDLRARLHRMVAHPGAAGADPVDPGTAAGRSPRLHVPAAAGRAAKVARAQAVERGGQEPIAVSEAPGRAKALREAIAKLRANVGAAQPGLAETGDREEDRGVPETIGSDGATDLADSRQATRRVRPAAHEASTTRTSESDNDLFSNSGNLKQPADRLTAHTLVSKLRARASMAQANRRSPKAGQHAEPSGTEAAATASRAGLEVARRRAEASMETALAGDPGRRTAAAARGQDDEQKALRTRIHRLLKEGDRAARVAAAARPGATGRSAATAEAGEAREDPEPRSDAAPVSAGDSAAKRLAAMLQRERADRGAIDRIVAATANRPARTAVAAKPPDGDEPSETDGSSPAGTAPASREPAPAMDVNPGAPGAGSGGTAGIGAKKRHSQLVAKLREQVGESAVRPADAGDPGRPSASRDSIDRTNGDRDRGASLEKLRLLTAAAARKGRTTSSNDA